MAHDVSLSGPWGSALINTCADAEARDSIEAALGATLPGVGEPVTKADSGRMVMMLGPHEWLVKTTHEDESVCYQSLDRIRCEHHTSVVIVSDSYCGFTLAGPDCLQVLSQAVGIDLDVKTFPPGFATRTAFAKVTAVLHRVQESRFDIYVDFAVSCYVEAFLDAAIGPGGGRRVETDG